MCLPRSSDHGGSETKGVGFHIGPSRLTYLFLLTFVSGTLVQSFFVVPTKGQRYLLVIPGTSVGPYHLCPTQDLNLLDPSL